MTPESTSPTTSVLDSLESLSKAFEKGFADAERANAARQEELIAALQDIHSYVNVLAGLADVEAGRTVPHEEVMAEIQKRREAK